MEKTFDEAANDGGENKNALYAALAKAEGAIGAFSKNAANPFLKSRYATLDRIIEVVKKPLADNGLFITNRLNFGEKFKKLVPLKDKESKKIIFNKDGSPKMIEIEMTAVEIVSVLGHESGQVIECAFRTECENTPQAIGSAYTYGRRYNLLGLLNISAGDEDDDGEAATNRGSGNAKPYCEACGVEIPLYMATKSGRIYYPDYVLEKTGLLLCVDCAKKRKQEQTEPEMTDSETDGFHSV